MNKRLIFLVAGVLLLVGLWWLFRGNGLSRQTPATSQAPSTTKPIATPAVQSVANPVSSNAAAPATPLAPPTIKSREEIMQAEWNATNSKALDFYGKVVDQDGSPIPGVKVKAGVGLVINFERSGGKDYFTETDAHGRFSFVGIHGAGVGFTLTKEGYFYNQRLPATSRPKDYVPDPDNPVIFSMWKLKGAEPMVHAKVHAYVPCDGTATRYDILTGRKAASGDLVLTLTRNPVDIVRGRPFDWKATVELANGGGFVALNDTYPNEAPAEGYEPKLALEMPAQAKGWSAAFERAYYFKSGNGKIYGRMTVSIQADFQPPPTSFDVEIYANPNGSRNLEYDPRQDLAKPKPPTPAKAPTSKP